MASDLPSLVDQAENATNPSNVFGTLADERYGEHVLAARWMRRCYKAAHAKKKLYVAWGDFRTHGFLSVFKIFADEPARALACGFYLRRYKSEWTQQRNSPFFVYTATPIPPSNPNSPYHLAEWPDCLALDADGVQRLDETWPDKAVFDADGVQHLDETWPDKAVSDASDGSV